MRKRHKWHSVTVTPGQRIRALRLERGWTQKDLAQRVGNIDHSGISNIERGAAPVGDRRGVRIARAFGVSMEEIGLGEVQQPTIATLDTRLRDIEGTLVMFRSEAGIVREALTASLASIGVRLGRIEESLERLAAQARTAGR